MSERKHRGHLVLPDRFDCKNWYLAQLHMSRAAGKCTTAAEESCTTRTMRKNCIGSRAGSDQEQGPAGPE